MLKGLVTFVILPHLPSSDPPTMQYVLTKVFPSNETWVKEVPTDCPSGVLYWAHC
jgi:hypothetical protein